MDGTHTQSLEEVNDRFFEHFKDILNQESNVPPATWDNILPKQKARVTLLGLPFSLEECSIALSQCPDSRTPGISNIPIEGLKYGLSKESLYRQCELFNDMLSNGYVPQAMKEVRVLPIHKKVVEITVITIEE